MLEALLLPISAKVKLITETKSEPQWIEITPCKEALRGLKQDRLRGIGRRMPKRTKETALTSTDSKRRKKQVNSTREWICLA